MIDWNNIREIPSPTGVRKSKRVLVICDQCSAERWVWPYLAKRLKTPGHLCVKCSTGNTNKAARKYTDIPDVQYRTRNKHVLIPVICPRCHQERYANAKLGSVQLCSSCACILKKKDRDEFGKGCPRCKIYKPWSDYTTNNRMTDKRSTYCRSCTKARIEERGKPVHHAGLNRHQWRELLEKYDHRCVCCMRQDLRLEADHVILCGPCNRAKRTQTIDYRPGFRAAFPLLFASP
jgi:hypothetical protein